MDEKWTTVVQAEEVTEEVMEMARQVESGWYNDSPIDWEDVWERMEGQMLDDGSRLDLGPQVGSPAMKKIQKTIRAERRLG